jgi:hypothetical protein
VAFASCLSVWTSASISAAIASRAGWPAESLAPWTSSSRARWTVSVIRASAVSVTPVQAIASLTLRPYWRVPSSELRSESARLTPKGSSEGRVSSLPEVSLCCVRASRSALSWRSASSERESIELVIRVVI